MIDDEARPEASGLTFRRLAREAGPDDDGLTHDDVRRVYNALDAASPVAALAASAGLPELRVRDCLVELTRLGFVEAVLSGSLAGCPGPALAWAFATALGTGHLRVEGGGTERTLRFAAGSIVGATSTDPGEQLADVLIRDGVQGWDELRAFSPDDDDRLLTAIISKPIVADDVLREASLQHVVDVVAGLYRLTDGRYEVAACAPRALDGPRLPPIGPADALLQAARSVRGWSRIIAAIGDADCVYQLRSGAMPTLELTPEEWSLIGSAAEARTVGELYRASELSDYRIGQLVWFFRTIGVLYQPDGAEPEPLRAVRTALAEVSRSAVRVDDHVSGDAAPGAGVPTDRRNLAGRLKPHKLPDILRALYQGRSTGTLTVVSGRVTNRLFLSGGTIVAASSTAPEHRLGDTLRRLDLIDDAKLQQALAQCAPQPLGQYLLQHGVLTDAQLNQAILVQFREVLKPMFNWDRGRFWFAPGEPRLAGLPNVERSMAELVFGGVRSMLDHAGVRDLLQGALGRLGPTEEPLLRFQLLRLRPDEAALLRMVDGRTSFRDLLAGSALGGVETIRVLYALLATGVLELVSADDDRTRVPIEVGDEAPELSPEQVAAAAIKMETAAPGAVLGVADNADAAPTRAAYERCIAAGVSVSMRESGLRASPGVWSSPEDIDRLLELLSAG